MLGEYPLLCSDRYLIVKSCLELCDELGTRHFGHGCTGMGNDQLRFDQTVRSLGDYEIQAPIRDLQSRVQAVRDYELQVMADAAATRSMKTFLVSPFPVVRSMKISHRRMMPGP